MNAGDPFDLARFVNAQEVTYAAALAELIAGRKRSHWMWFVFPQLRGLGMSETAIFYGIGSLDEARAYLVHAVLAPRLVASTHAVLDATTPTLAALFGSPDDMKFRSSMTLFAAAAGPSGSLYAEAIGRRCGGQLDERTLALLAH